MNMGVLPFPSGRTTLAQVSDVLLDDDLSGLNLSPEGYGCAILDIPAQYDHLEIYAEGRVKSTGYYAGTWYLFFNDDRTHTNYKIIGNQIEGGNSLYHDNWPYYGRIPGTDSPRPYDNGVLHIFIPFANVEPSSKVCWSVSGLRRNTNHTGDGLAVYDFCVFWQTGSFAKRISKIELGTWGQKFLQGSRIQIIGHRNAMVGLAE